MTSTTSITKAEPGHYGFTMKATTPSGREFIVVILHATWVMDLGVNVQFLTPPELRSCESCFYATADSSLLKSDTLHFKFDNMHELISHLNTL